MEKNTKMTKTRRSCHRPPLPLRSEDPWLIYTHGNRRTTQSFYSISENHYYSKSIPELNNNDILTCSHGWLVMLGKEMDDLNCFLLNPVSMRKTKLPQWRGFDFEICLLTAAPDSGTDCVVAFFEQKGPSVMFCRPGDKDWTVQELPLETIYGEGAGGIDTAVTCGGKIYGLLGVKRKPVVIDVDDGGGLTLRHQQGIEEVPPPDLSYSVICFSRYLVESCGELFFVYILRTISGDKSWDEYGKFKIPRIEVFKLDFEQLVWKKVKTLGDHRAFLQGMSNCLSCPSTSSTTRTTATEPTDSESAEEDEQEGVKANCIYFILSKVDKNLYVYNMEEGTLAVSYLFPSVVHNMHGPDWILPVCNS